jgi:biopolymer transport protein TolQ
MDASVWDSLAKATPVAKAVLVLLVAMSFGSWMSMCALWRSYAKAQAILRRGVASLLETRDLAATLRALENTAGSPWRLARLGVGECDRLAVACDDPALWVDNLRRVMRLGIAEEIERLGRALPLLATTANAAPFIGLFGTVWGIMHSFHAIGQMRSASLATVAPGISEALIATAMGLAVAIPATVGYNILLGRLSRIESQAIGFSGLLINRIRQEAVVDPAGARKLLTWACGRTSEDRAATAPLGGPVAAFAPSPAREMR